VEIVAADIGGTHARFALAEIADGRVVHLGEAVTLKCADHASLALAWARFADILGRPPPRAIAIAIACPVGGDVLKLTNNPWIIRQSEIGETLHVERWRVINDFGAVAHAVAHLGEEHFVPVAGPRHPLPREGVISIVGPGTGLGVGHVLRSGAHYHVLESEGGHIDFAPLDAFDDRILGILRQRYSRVSIERLVSGPGLANLYEAFAVIEGKAVTKVDDKTLWKAALDGSDALAAAAFDRFCLCLGAVCGDVALMLGAKTIVIGGGIGPRIAPFLPQSGFAARFTAKGRFATLMADIPVYCIIHPQPGLYGAAAAFAIDHPNDH